ncbi:heavy metal translocating P-type ATPase [Acinetobacter sedimenti]|nr:heavy metal translocating P-type ATPase [Acinetobacter sedimenti]
MSQQAPNQQSINQQQKTLNFDVKGMSCASCVGRVERAIAKVNGVDSVNVNLATERTTVQISDSAADVELSTSIAQAIEKAGYQATLHQDPQQINTPAKDDVRTVLRIDGMSCASCVGRVERALQKLEGVIDASVNLATEIANIHHTSMVDTDQLITQVEQAGYQATVVQQQSNSTTEHTTQLPQKSYSERRQHEANELFKKLIVAIILALPVFILEMGSHFIPTLHHWVASNIGIQNSWYLQFILATLVLIFSGRLFYTHGIPALFRGAPDMNTLVAVGSLAAYSFSIIATFLPQLLPEASLAVYYESVVVIIVLILFGRYLEAKAKGQTSQAIEKLIQLQPKVAHVKRDGQFIDVEITDVKSNDIVMIKPSESVPFDGVVIEGQSYIDESMITGESIAVQKTVNAQVIGGTLNQQGQLIVQVRAVGSDTALAKIIQLVENAQSSKLPIQNLVDKITMWFVPTILVIAVLTFLAWMLFSEQGLSFALINAVSVLIIACPCAMGLATPMSIMVGTGRAAELGILFRDVQALQSAKDIQAVAFDKTGTLTEGHPILTDLLLAPDVKDNDVDLIRQYAASLESASEHPIAKSIVEDAQTRGLALLPITDFQAHVGLGVQAQIDGKTIRIGSGTWMQQLGFSTTALQPYFDELTSEAKTTFYLSVDEQIFAVIAVADEAKADAKSAIKALYQEKFHVAMVSGDQQKTAEAIAQSLGIDQVIANVKPAQKVEAISALQVKYGKVAFVGDGINDAPALAHADLGIAMGTGTDIAIETADVVLMNGHVSSVVDCIALSSATIRNIQQNLFWAFIYNVALIPVAAGVLYPLNGMLLSPMFAAFAMALSSVFVVTNALRLKRFQSITAKN